MKYLGKTFFVFILLGQLFLSFHAQADCLLEPYHHQIVCGAGACALDPYFHVVKCAESPGGQCLLEPHNHQIVCGAGA
ncbi:hypothetical protein, partial [Legionella sp. 39-23]